MNKTFVVEKKGKRLAVLIRQAPHDPQYKVGSHIPSYGKVVEVRSDDVAVRWTPETARQRVGGTMGT